MKSGYFKSVLKTSLLTTLFGIGAFSANGAGHLPSTYQVEGKNHGRVIDSIITEIAPGLMRIENKKWADIFVVGRDIVRNRNPYLKTLEYKEYIKKSI